MDRNRLNQPQSPNRNWRNRSPVLTQNSLIEVSPRAIDCSGDAGVVMADWRYQYHVENDSEANHERLRQWRAQGSDLKMKQRKKFPWFLVIIGIVAVILLWGNC